MYLKKWVSVMLLIGMVTTLVFTGSPAASAAGYKAADFTAAIANANIDAVIYLDYEAGINAGVYKWVLSEDGDYYALAAVDESGEPIKAQESAIIRTAHAIVQGEMPDLQPGKESDFFFFDRRCTACTPAVGSSLR